MTGRVDWQCKSCLQYDETRICLQCEWHCKICLQCEWHCKIFLQYKWHCKIRLQCEWHCNICFQCEWFCEICFQCEWFCKICLQCEWYCKICFQCEWHCKSCLQWGERGGSVVECRTPEREVRGSRPTAAVLCPWARHFTPRKYWLITQEAMAPSRHDWKIVDWDVKPQHNQPKASSVNIMFVSSVNVRFDITKICLQYDWLWKICLQCEWHCKGCLQCEWHFKICLKCEYNVCLQCECKVFILLR